MGLGPMGHFPDNSIPDHFKEVLGFTHVFIHGFFFFFPSSKYSVRVNLGVTLDLKQGILPFSFSGNRTR